MLDAHVGVLYCMCVVPYRTVRAFGLDAHLSIIIKIMWVVVLGLVKSCCLWERENEILEIGASPNRTIHWHHHDPLLFVPRLPPPRSASSRAILPSPFCLSPPPSPPPLFLPLLFCLGHDGRAVAVAVD